MTAPQARETGNPQAASEQAAARRARNDATSWAAKVERLAGALPPDGAIALNVDGRRPTSPLQGFGRMWEKTYRIRLEGASVDPATVVAEWKANFGSFWPRNNFFFGAPAGIAPGDVAVLNLHMPLGVKLATGVLVLYADDDAFTVMTPEGHQFAGFNTFSASRADDGTTVAEIRALVRGSDPLYELFLTLGIAHLIEDRFWQETLRRLAAHFGVHGQPATLERVCVDRQRQWRQWRNLWHNALVRSALYMVVHPLRVVRARRAAAGRRG